ncbi:hypothetical protein FHS83_003726 [Rhizomicrobium palustre]|uniref:Uncharacterized protein n=1 Tax=Rhizomicrobium palustre TaxID=189966 RepID=A0A846N363_9PROT|nr:hypothetical protein [Rhizomicrobium palustre]NIK90408.1 hypothetical protein [Rhizomicrobium palustre]
MATKTQIRTQLLKDAFAGRFSTYKDFGSSVGMIARGPWDVLNDIAREEMNCGYPDITVLIFLQETGYPAQLDFVKTSSPPGPQERATARTKAQEVIDLYCPGAVNPY